MSGNRCAFPKCPLPLVDAPSGKVTGRVCHIRASSPKGPRHHPTQSASERHDFGNLILLCPIHHDVIDSDSDAYSVDRLLAMKRDHEIANNGGEEPADEIALALINSSSVVMGDGAVLLAVGQSTGQVAHTINNVFGAPSSAIAALAASKLHDKRMEVCGELWQRLGRAQGAVYRVGSAFRETRDVDNVDDEEYRSFVAGNAAFSSEEKRKLLEAKDRTAALSEVAWCVDLRAARDVWRDLHNYANATRIYLSDGLKALVARASAIVSRVITHAEIARSEERLNFEATLVWLNELDRLLDKIEACMAAEMRGA